METKKVAKEYLQKDIIMDFAGYEERSYSERFIRCGNGKRMISRSKESSY